jgi:hypothetical protein
MPLFASLPFSSLVVFEKSAQLDLSITDAFCQGPKQGCSLHKSHFLKVFCVLKRVGGAWGRWYI